MLHAKQVADYILSLSDPEEGDIISHLKLQKLLYYVQGFCLAVYNRPLFSEEICAWNHGPVVEEVYQLYKGFGSNHIPPPTEADFSAFSPEEKELINDVYTVYGQFSAWRLRHMTHEEPPWRSTEQDEVISHGKLKEYFLTQLTDA